MEKEKMHRIGIISGSSLDGIHRYESCLLTDAQHDKYLSLGKQSNYAIRCFIRECGEENNTYESAEYKQPEFGSKELLYPLYLDDYKLLIPQKFPMDKELIDLFRTRPLKNVEIIFPKSIHND